ncbi:hypothetical protein RJ639_016031 [Escallonia herrerae]|uniref:Uncharacterized protein n=1 Tax=Escallonia herrerae TaxID=1293975 RepID=A0AA88VC91_9ASTE|nr:hypothetical protein RJ639_016031 [Escallonia herrerae]
MATIPTHHQPSNPPSPDRSEPRYTPPRPLAPASWAGVKPIPLLICVTVGLIFRFAVPKPAQVSKQAWQLFAIFLTTIAGLILSPLPVGAWAFICLTVTVITKTLPFAAAFSAFTNEVIWLIVASFFFSRGFVKTGLGDRIAMYFVRWLGKSTLGLSYGLALGEAVICPAMPSSTARAGGIFLPIIKSLSSSADSEPKDASARKLGAYLIQSQLQSACSSSGLFLTAAAQNLLCVKLAEALGVEVKVQWVTWFKAASLPALISLLATPLILYKIFPPETKSTPDAPIMAARKLESMGPVKRNEWVMVGTMLITITLWVSGETLGVASVVAAMLGLSILLLLGVLDWDDCLSEKSAWDTLAWFGVLVGMAAQLTALGITAHVGALYSAFLSMHLASKVPGLLAALALGYNTNLFGALTHYSSGQAAVYYGGLSPSSRFDWYDENSVEYIVLSKKARSDPHLDAHLSLLCAAYLWKGEMNDKALSRPIYGLGHGCEG